MNRMCLNCEPSGAASRTPRKIGFVGLLVLVLTGGCSDIPVQQPLSPAVTASTRAAETLNATEVFVYPNKGQSAQQLDRDRYECYLWGVEQTGFDPSQPSLAPHQRVEVVAAPPPGTDAVVGAVTGAMIGAAVSRPRDSAEGAVVGAVLGGILGGATSAARSEEIQKRYAERESDQLARLERQSTDYRRALTACLEGRGYTVK